MITKYKLFEHNNIKYISDGEYTCPVCGNDKLDIFECENNTQMNCKKCDFEFFQIFKYIFNGSESYSGFSSTEISDDNRNIEDGFVSTGEKTCPFCDSKDINKDSSDTNGEEDYIDMSCNVCKESSGDPNVWRLYYIKTFQYSDDKNGNKIKIGDKVDVELINVEKYKKIKVNRFNL
jgi:transcription elongation factor Elf1